jgi:hypothetical protein
MGEWAGRLISTGAPADEPVPRWRPGQCAAPGVATVRFLADPGHQEDVVVDTERDQEHDRSGG